MNPFYYSNTSCGVTTAVIQGDFSGRFLFSFPEQLQMHLALSAEQVAKIEAQNEAFARWSAERSQRTFAVQMEIAIETARSPLDPAALGVRYAEVEAIRREVAEREKATLAENVAALTAAQLTKLKALEEAMKLVPTGSAAQSVRLLPCEANSYATILLGSVIPAGGSIPIYAPSTSCGATGVIGTGGFVFPQP
ncbi:MAG: hypothetical protein IT162_16640 [Bryobacterales bacterium]|nr:hypothetical protein [Bryobacterales bacterium]